MPNLRAHTIAHIHCKSLFIYFMHAVHFQSKVITCRFTIRCHFSPIQSNLLHGGMKSQSQKLCPIFHKHMSVKLHCKTKWEVAMLNDPLWGWFLLYVSMEINSQLTMFLPFQLVIVQVVCVITWLVSVCVHPGSRVKIVTFVCRGHSVMTRSLDVKIVIVIRMASWMVIWIVTSILDSAGKSHSLLNIISYGLVMS